VALLIGTKHDRNLSKEISHHLPTLPEEYGYGDGWIRCDKCGAKAMRYSDSRSGHRVYFFRCQERSCARKWGIVKSEVAELR
jgi:hypothetical protein